MNAVQAVDELKIISIWLAEASHREMDEVPEPYMNHLMVLPGELRDLRDLFILHERKFLTLSQSSPERASA